jgi:hypothetical protein
MQMSIIIKKQIMTDQRRINKNIIEKKSTLRPIKDIT